MMTMFTKTFGDITLNYPEDYCKIADIRRWAIAVQCAEYILDNEDEFGITDKYEAFNVAWDAWSNLIDNITGDDEDNAIHNAIKNRSVNKEE